MGRPADMHRTFGVHVLTKGRMRWKETTMTMDATAAKKQMTVTYEYNGQFFPDAVVPNQQIEASWHKALQHFAISPADARSQNLGLFLNGNPVDRHQSFASAGITENATLRIQPLVQGTGQR